MDDLTKQTIIFNEKSFLIRKEAARAFEKADESAEIDLNEIYENTQRSIDSLYQSVKKLKGEILEEEYQKVIDERDERSIKPEHVSDNYSLEFTGFEGFTAFLVFVSGFIALIAVKLNFSR